MAQERIHKVKKAYFGCAIAGGRDYAHMYGEIVQLIKDMGYDVVSEIFSHLKLKPEVGMKMDPSVVWKRDVEWVRAAEACIFEVTQPSLGVGYEIAIAEAANKPILALFYKDSRRRLSPMISGNSAVQVVEYSKVTDLVEIIKNFLS